MPRFSRKEEAICPSCGEWKTTDFTPEELQEREWECSDCMNKRLTNPEDLPENRGQKEISKYSPEYDFLKRLINLVVKEGVPPEEIKALSLSSPFQTIDDLGDLTAKIWTLATEKYRIPRQWLIKKLPERKLKSDLWPGQEASQPGTQAPWNYYAYTYGQDKDTSVSGPRPDDVEKKSSPETDHALAMSIGEDIINEYFFQKNIRWSQVVQFIKDQSPQLSDADIFNLKTDTQYKLEQYKIQINSKKKGISLDKVLQILEQKGPKPTHVDYTDLTIELEDGSKMSFDEATRKALDLSKSGSEESEEQERNKDAGTGFYDSPGNFDMGKRPQSDESIWPADTWLPRGTEELDSQTWDNIAASKKFSKRELTASVGKLWIDPNGNEFKVARNDSHYGWIATKYKHNVDSSEIDKIANKMFREGWSRITPGSEFGGGVDYAIQVDDIRNVPKYLDDFVAKTFRGKPIGLTDIANKYVEIEEPFPSFQKAVNKSLSRKRLGKKIAFQKISKPKSGYVDNGIGYTCGRCEYFNPEKERCKLVEGTIKSFGCCNFWDGGDKEATTTKGSDRALTKEEAVYVQYPNVDYRCDECAFFDPKAKSCTKVEGEISPTASCNLWQPISKKQSNKQSSLSIQEAMVKATKELMRKCKLENISEIGAGYCEDWVSTVKKYFPDIKRVDYSIAENIPHSVIEYNGKYYDAETPQGVSSLEELPFSQRYLHLGPIQLEDYTKESNLNKKANPPSRFWIAPDGKEFEASIHGLWLKQNPEILKSYGISPVTGSGNLVPAWTKMIDEGWTRLSNEPHGNGFQIEVKDIKNLPFYLDDIIAKYFKEGDKIQLGGNGYVVITDPFPSIQKAVNKALRNPVNAMLKKADVSGKQINDILALIEQTGGATYNLQSGNLTQTPMFAVSTHKDRERIVDLVDYDTLEGYIVDNQDLLNSSDNSLGAWSHDGKVFLDVVSTVSSKEEALKLAHDNQQLAIFDLKTMTELPVGIPAFSKKELNIVKKAKDNALPQNIQDEIAAKWSPAMNILLNNYIEAKSRGHDRQRSFDYAYESIQNLDTNITEKQAMEAINTYTIGLA